MEHFFFLVQCIFSLWINVGLYFWVILSPRCAEYLVQQHACGKHPLASPPSSIFMDNLTVPRRFAAVFTQQTVLHFSQIDSPVSSELNILKVGDMKIN